MLSHFLGSFLTLVTIRHFLDQFLQVADGAVEGRREPHPCRGEAGEVRHRSVGGRGEVFGTSFSVKEIRSLFVCPFASLPLSLPLSLYISLTLSSVYYYVYVSFELTVIGYTHTHTHVRDTDRKYEVIHTWVRVCVRAHVFQ